MTDHQESDIGSGSWKDPLKGCIVQNDLIFGDMDSNLSDAGRLIDSIPDDDIDLIVLPELFATGFDYEGFPEHIRRAGEVTDLMKRIAVEAGSHIIFTQIVEDGGRIFNRLFMIGRKGDVIGHYDKTHLFTRAKEDKHFTRGDHLTLFEMEGVKVGPLICYESRFPELSRRLVLDGAQILVYPSQWPEFRVDQWTTLLRARAIENQCFVIGSGVCGGHENSPMGGMSSAFSPFGDLLGEIGKGEGWVVFEMDPVVMNKLRRKIPVLREIREDLEIS